MELAELTQALRQTLVDHRLSRSEKQGLKDLIGAAAEDKHKAALIRSQVFDIARAEIDSQVGREVTDWLEAALKLLIPVEKAPPPRKVQSEAFFSSMDQCSGKIVSIIGKMRRSIDICVFTITDDRISNAIIDSHKRGVKIRIVTDDRKSGDRGSDIQRLAAAGIDVRMDASRDHMHHKYALFDGAYLLTGSYNWTRSADLFNKENFIVTNDPELFEEFQNHFEAMWRGYQ